MRVRARLARGAELCSVSLSVWQSGEPRGALLIARQIALPSPSHFPPPSSRARVPAPGKFIIPGSATRSRGGHGGGTQAAGGGRHERYMAARLAAGRHVCETHARSCRGLFKRGRASSAEKCVAK